ncbi:MAG: hypothetical protein ACI9QD_000200 [Thermoproteota archaeon]|jgi:uncharacterized protein YbjT (DUF2867 family)
MAPEILIIGATGFVGASLLDKLESANVPVRVMARTPKKVLSNSKHTQIIQGDLFSKDTLAPALLGIKTIYYLVHAMSEEGNNFSNDEMKQAQNIAACLNSTHRIIYLGAIIPNKGLSNHLKSRANVGEIFRNTKAKTIEFRASIIIGKGSASFEIVRSLVERLPFILTAKWSKALCQPIALFNVIKYLEDSGDIEILDKDSIFNIGGKDIITYEEILLRYTKYKKLKRLHINIEELPVSLAQKVLKYIVPEHANVGGHLLGSIEHETIVHDHRADDVFGIRCFNLEESFKLAKDEPLKEIPVKTLMEQIEMHELPNHINGQTIQLFLPYISFGRNADEVLKSFTTILTQLPSGFSFESKKSLSLTIPQIGELKFFEVKDRKGLYLAIKPKFYFQKLGWVLLKNFFIFVNQKAGNVETYI